MSSPPSDLTLGTLPPTFEAIPNNIQAYQAHFLLLPLEIRQMIFEKFATLTTEKRVKNWHEKPTPEFVDLLCVCRQLYSEIKTFLPQVLVSKRNFSQFYASLRDSLQHKKPLNGYRSLTIQFSLNAPPEYFKALAAALSLLRGNLEELNLSFTGLDSSRTLVHPHGCAYNSLSSQETRLPYTGQRKNEMLLISRVLFTLLRLRVLVLSNFNAPLHQAIFNHKPKLEYLHITADPRSALHRRYTLAEIGPLLMPIRAPMPPVKVLHIPANSMAGAFALASACAETIEHLTWTIPDPFLGSNKVGADFFNNTLQLVNNLALNFSKIKTFRVCVQGNELYHIQGYTDLVRAITGATTALSNLEDYEVHLNSKTQFLGPQILESLPHGLKRFYTNCQLVEPLEVLYFVNKTYLSATTAVHQDQHNDWHTTGVFRPPSDSAFVEDCDCKCCCETVDVWFDSLSNGFTYDRDGVNEADSAINQAVTRSWLKSAQAALYCPGIIGEDFRRKDYIPLRNGDLKFLSYEFKISDPESNSHIEPENLTQMMLRINGRLLDRDRNKHLARFAPGQPIPPRDIRTGQYRRRFGIKHQRDVYKVEIENQKRVELLSEELAASSFKDDERYFGRENEACQVFHDERVARPEDLSPLTYPCYTDSDGGHEHCCWMCPDAYVPSLSEMDKMSAH